MNIEELIQKTKVFLLDMDGTIYLDSTPIGDMKNTLLALRKAGKQIVYCTNNSSKTPNEYEEKLKRIGFWEDGDIVYTSGMSTIEYLKEKYPQKTVHALCMPEVKKSFLDAGIVLVDSNPDVCVLAFDTQLDYNDLRKFNELLYGNCVYIATHPDAVCPTENIPMPDAGSFIKLFECTSGRLPDIICGKPDTIMGDMLLNAYGFNKSEVVMVGDRLHTDIRFANNNGFYSILVLSGETTKDMIKNSPDHPTVVLDSLNDVVKYL